MSRVSALFILLAFSSICFGATLMQMAIAVEAPEIRERLKKNH